MLTKIVNGTEEQCSAEEEVAIRAEWAANDPKLAQERSLRERTIKREAAQAALIDQLMDVAGKDPEAPQAIKDYLEAAK